MNLDIRLLHRQLSALGLTVARSEEETTTYGETTAAAVRQVQQQQRLPVTGVADEVTLAAIERAARLTSTVYLTGRDDPAAVRDDPAAVRDDPAAVRDDPAAVRDDPAAVRADPAAVRADPAAGGEAPAAPSREPAVDRQDAATAPSRQVSGTIYDQYGLPLAGLGLVACHIGFGCEAVPLGRTVTGEQGWYEIAYQHDGVVNLQIRAFDPAGREVALSRPTYRAADREVINLVCPATVRPAEPEHRRLLADLAPHLGTARLGQAKEDGDCRDITLLARTSGWDARLVALAASADRLAATTGVSDHALYAMLRVGLPAEARQLGRLSPSTVDMALTRARAAGIAELTDAEIEDAKAALAEHARFLRLNEPAAPGTLSTVAELLSATGLTEPEQRAFDAIVAGHAGTGDELWAKVREAGISERQVRSLQVQGKLAQLTLNNAPLIAALQRDAAEGLPQLLLDKDLHLAEAWVGYLRGLAPADDQLAELIPPAYRGETVADRLAGYAADLARKVRIALPTHVVACRIEAGELPVAQPEQVAQVLRKAADDPQLRFRFGTTPTRTFLRRNPQLMEGVAEPKAVADALVTLHRVYQLTPSDQAMGVLLAEKLTSAHVITRSYQHDTFVEAYADKVGGANLASRIYRKAELVSAVAYNAFAAAQHLSSTPVVYAVSAAADVAKASTENIRTHFPTLEGLFGELDFCECESCRSVLSPAAYLVDLLQFLDPDPAVWDHTLLTWKSKHAVAYPFGSPNELAQWQQAHPGVPVPAPQTPYQRLVQRRPDLPNLQLSCENTNTVLPYIDVVNEILEFSVAHQNEQLPARDIAGANSDDLLAEPQWVLAEAYPILAQAQYPLALPYDLALDTARRLLDQLDVPLPRLLAELCPASDLSPVNAPAGRPDYGWRDVFREQLGLSPAEYDLFAAGETDWHLRYGYPDAPTARAELVRAKTLARRLAVTYRELVDLVKCWFVNPELDTLALLRTLELDTTDVMRYYGVNGVPPFDAKEAAAFETHLADLGKAHGVYNIKGWLDNAFASNVFDRVLVLADPDTGCSFEHTTLRFFVAQNLPADAYDGVLARINLLVRLQRRLGWKLAEVDAALRALLPAATPLGDALKTALLYLAHLQTLTTKAKFGRDARVALLSLWTTMDPSRYARLFLVPGKGVKDPVFDNPLGHYLSNPAEPLADHLPAVQGALNLSTDDIKLILGAQYEAAPLTMATLSLLDRHALLARALKLSVGQLQALRELSGVDPFAPLAPASVTSLGADAPHETLRFVEIADAVKAAGLKVDELDFLLRHRFDQAGPLRPSPERVLAFIRHLSDEITRIRTEHAVPADGLEFTDEVIAQKLALVLPAEVATTFLGMWAGTIPYYAERPATPADQLDPAAYAGEPAVSVWYDPVRQRQHLTYRGVPRPAEVARLKTDHPGQLFAGLLDDVAPQAAAYFDAHLAEPVGFLTAPDFDLLFGPMPAPAPPPPSAALQAEAWQRQRRRHLAEAFLPYLQDRLIRTMAVTTLAGEFAAPPELVAPLVTDDSLLRLDGQPLLKLVVQAEVAGLTVTHPDGDSLRMEGFVEVPATGAYRFAAELPAAATAELRFGHLTDPVAAGAPGDFDAVELAAGTLYHLTLRTQGTGAAVVALDFVAENLPRGPIDRLRCYPQATTEQIGRAHVLLGKVLRLAGALELTEAELRHLDQGFLATLPTTATDPAAAFAALRRLLDYVALRHDLNASGTELIDIFRYAHRLLPASDPPQLVLADVGQRVATLTRRTVETVTEAAAALGYAVTSTPATGGNDVTATGFTDVDGVRRLWQLLSLTKALGVAPAVAANWANPAPSMSDADALRTTLKARFELDAWRRVARPVFDLLRRSRRDALVAYLLHRDGFASVEELFEHFLVDPGTEPVVQTSRLRLAVSSVQTFIQRCLMNLEFGVRPQVISATQWAWMKRYRVWEANRKLFLWPENWLEPEFRDDKTHLFQALEGELLQGDVSQDLAEDALYHYLSGLDKIARLEIVSTWLQEHPGDPAHNILHVAGRTYNKPNEYFYRRYQHHAWTPWVPVGASIESDHVVLTVWRNRPHLFWLTFLDRSQPTADSIEISSPIKIVDVQLHWAEYVNDQWVAAEATDLNRPLTSQVVADFDRNRVFVHATTLADDERDEVTIHLSVGGEKHQPATSGNSYSVYEPQSVPQATYRSYDVMGSPTMGQIGESIPHATAVPSIYQAFHLVGRNAPVEILGGSSAPVSPPFTWSGVQATQYQGSGALTVWYTSRIEKYQGKTTEDKQPQNVLNKGGSYRLVTAPSPVTTTGAPEIGSVIRPFFYQDERHTFYVEPTLTERVFHEWDRWIVAVPKADPPYQLVPYWERLHIEQSAPRVKPPDGISPVALFELRPAATSQDSVLGAAMTVQFGGSLVGAGGAIHGR